VGDNRKVHGYCSKSFLQQSLEDTAANTPGVSKHCYGRAIDFDAPGDNFGPLQNYLESRKQELSIDRIIPEGNHLHVQVKAGS
jgi:hypothetical protein